MPKNYSGSVQKQHKTFFRANCYIYGLNRNKLNGLLVDLCVGLFVVLVSSHLDMTR